MAKDREKILKQIKKSLNLGNSEEQIAQIMKKKFEDEIKGAKKLKDLIFSEDFSVQEVISRSYANSITPHSEMVYGGISPSYETGFSSQLVLKVTPIDSKIPIKTLNFNGFSIVEAGDYISALVPRYTSKSFNNPNNIIIGDEYMKDTYYFDRKFKLEELAIQLVIFDRGLFDKGDKKILRTDIAIEYNQLMNS